MQAAVSCGLLVSLSSTLSSCLEFCYGLLCVDDRIVGWVGDWHSHCLKGNLRWRSEFGGFKQRTRLAQQQTAGRVGRDTCVRLGTDPCKTQKHSTMAI